MTSRRRLLVYGAVLALVLVTLTAGWFYRSTRQKLERAEAFAFRRMTVARQGEQGVYRFFYATNRRLESGEGTIEERFTNQREEGLRFGAFDTKIQPTLGLGMIVNPTDWFTNEALQVLNVRELDQAALVEGLRQQVAASPHRALLVLVHGYRNSFPASLRMTSLVAHVLDVNAPVMMLDWPGDQGWGIGGYRRAQGVAADSGAELAQALQLIAAQIQPDKIWLMANSMGAKVVTSAFDTLCEAEEWKDTDTEIEHVVLTAPDVGKQDFNEHFKEEITALARHLSVYVSSNDRALLASRLVNRQRRLGESQLDPGNPDQFAAAACIADLLEPGSQRISLIDVTPVNRTRNFHNFSLETPEFFDDLYLRLTNSPLPRNRLIYAIAAPDGAVYWVLTRGR
jgi:esterase/lipase superfamily enzyme